MKPGSIPISDYTYNLPEGRIAHHPLDNRDESKLLVYKRGMISHKSFRQLPEELDSRDILFFNDTRVIPARLLFEKETGATIEIFLLNPLKPSTILSDALAATSAATWACTIGNLKRWNEGVVLRKSIATTILEARLLDRQAGQVEFSWTGSASFAEILQEAGKIPLPPYIRRPAEASDQQRYQTVYAHFEGAVAAPTAGLHFTEDVLQGIQSKGVLCEFLTLHVSAGTFMPVKNENAIEHPMHREQVVVDRSVIEKLLAPGRRVVAVGTTAMRTLESIYWYGAKLCKDPKATFSISSFEPYEDLDPPSLSQSLKAILEMIDRNRLTRIVGETAIYIVPGYQFRVCNALITNFHQPGSTLLLLIAAFIGKDWKTVYQEALAKDYRFLSYGDSSLLLP